MYTAICFTGAAQQANADVVYTDEVIVQASLCVGLDCVNGESFNFDTIRLKENNVRIKFQDSSSTSSFPSNDWQLTANDSTNGGQNQFSIEDISNSKVPFKILAGAPNHSIYVRSNGYVGFNTSTPLVNLQTTTGNSPTLRLEQDGSGGFTAQSWDVGGNETNFFVRDFTNGSRIPFKIKPSAPTNSLFIDVDGDIGFETASPDGLLDIAHPSDANNHAVLVSPLGNFGINIDNGQNVNSLFEIQSTGGVSEFSVASDGNTNVNGTFSVTGNSTLNGTFGVIGDSTLTGNANVVGTLNVTANNTSDSSVVIRNNDVPSAADVKTLLTLNSEHGSNIKFQHRGNATRDWTIGTYTSGNGLLFVRGDVSDGNADPYDNYMLLLNDNNMTFRNVSGATLMSLNDSGLTINGTFASASSRTFKENIMPVNPSSVLNTLSNLSISTWNYLSDGDKVKHMGPIAEEFYDAFGLGSDNKHITTTDANGVALASVIALNKELISKSEQISHLQNENEALKAKVEKIEQMLSKLKL